jgi:hypothetical protein
MVSFFTLLFAAPVEAGSASVMRIFLQCENTTMAAATCQAVKRAISKERSATQVTIANEDTESSQFDLRLTLELTRNDTDVLAGRLIWAIAGDQPVTGPVVEVSSFDAPLPPNAPNDLARGLLQVSNLPF